jgi:hypothetical protein
MLISFTPLCEIVKMGLLSGKRVEDAYKKGTNEGYLQGYREARRELS